MTCTLAKPLFRQPPATPQYHTDNDKQWHHGLKKLGSKKLQFSDSKLSIKQYPWLSLGILVFHL